MQYKKDEKKKCVAHSRKKTEKCFLKSQAQGQLHCSRALVQPSALTVTRHIWNMWSLLPSALFLKAFWPGLLEQIHRWKIKIRRLLNMSWPTGLHWSPLKARPSAVICMQMEAHCINTGPSGLVCRDGSDIDTAPGVWFRSDSQDWHYSTQQTLCSAHTESLLVIHQRSRDSELHAPTTPTCPTHSHRTWEQTGVIKQSSDTIVGRTWVFLSVGGRMTEESHGEISDCQVKLVGPRNSL